MDTVNIGNLDCFSVDSMIDETGSNVLEAKGGGDTYYRVTSINPPAGTLVARNREITLHVKTIPDSDRTAKSACNWISESQIAHIFGHSTSNPLPGGNVRGSTHHDCNYSIDPSTVLTINLASDRGLEFDTAPTTFKVMTAGQQSTTENGLGDRVACIGDPNSLQLVAVVDSRRLFYEWAAGSGTCDQLKDVARIAIASITASH